MGDSCQQCTHLRTQLKDSESIIAQVLSEVTTKTNIIDKLVLENEQLKHNVQELNLRLKSVIDDKMKISVSLDNKKDEQANILAQVLVDVTAKTCKLEKLVSENEQIQQTVQELNLRLNSVMADTMNKSGTFENTNDEYSNTKLAQRFDSHVKQIWIEVNDEIEEEFNEVDRLSILSEMCQNVFTAFHTEVDFANQRILDSIFSDEKTFDDSLLKEVRSARKLYSGKSTTREKQIEKILQSIQWSKEINRIISERPETLIKTFLAELADVSWLMVTSNPPLILNFDVKGKEYTARIKERFVECGTSEAISHCKCEPGHVLLVAWPSVELENNKGYLTKGEVVVMPNEINNKMTI
ncbi:uncharacterized protein LOC127879096 isoform X3 [Dreissena polymorpha]|uniref:uncharacterized protein LOC127879096 isoform X3 n=1 Tax=Dreissena polymorpha TaxID=45954 RepID=UPI002263FC6B|nr:uncharacterized protein LOC127879096 isoform X3 [Dreissena polymorpha]XP_052281670.1 uncharacterized protein LOC127879096 isoform X3 [Dreissena polymorpha]